LFYDSTRHDRQGKVMRFLISVIDSQTASATSEEYAAIDIFNARLSTSGSLVIACGVDDPETAQIIDARHGAPSARHTPLHVGDEWITGFWIVDVDNRNEAERLAEEASRACNRRVELRPLLG